MNTIGIWEEGAALEDLLLESLSPEKKAGLLLRISSRPEPFLRGSLDVLAIAPDAAIPREVILPRCRLLLLPGSAAPLVRGDTATCAMSYGTSPKDSLTFSSLGGHQLSISIQRELLTVDGQTIERQELQVQRLEGVDPLLQLACAGLLLLLATPPQHLHSRMARY